jgi:CHAT domain-containing protein/tetratricopeptide (TPR) repeat protein
VEQDYEEAFEAFKNDYKVLKEHPSYDASRDFVDRYQHLTELPAETDYVLRLVLLLMANVMEDSGDIASSTRLLQRAVEATVEIGEEDSDRYQRQLSALGGRYAELGDYLQAATLLHKSVALAQQLHGEHSDDYASALLRLAFFHSTVGDWGGAEALTRKGIAILREARVFVHPVYLQLLASFYSDKGEFDDALTVLGEAHAISQKNLALDESVTILHQTAAIHVKRGDLKSAEEIYRRCVRIAKSEYGEFSTEYADQVEHLSSFLNDEGRLRKALRLQEKVTILRRSLQGETHRNYGKAMRNLGDLKLKLSDLTGAAAALRKHAEIVRTGYGSEHPEYSDALANLAVACAAQSDRGEARELARESIRIDDGVIAKFFPMASEATQRGLLPNLNSHLHLFLSLEKSSHHPGSVGSTEAMCNAIVRRKGLVTEISNMQRALVLGSRDPEVLDRLHELAGLREQISRLRLNGVRTDDRRLQDWDARRVRLETELAQSLPGLDIVRHGSSTDVRQIAAALPMESALVEFFRFHFWQFGVADVESRGLFARRVNKYLAVVLPSRSPERVQLVDLGPAKAIDETIRDFRSAMVGVGRRDAMSRAGVDARVDLEVGMNLRRAVFDPLMGSLEGRTRVYLAPDSSLCRIPFEVMPIAAGRMLIDDYEFSYLSVGRDICRVSPRPKSLSPPVVIADPDYDFAGEGETTRDESERSTVRLRVGPEFRRSGMSFHRLNGTLDEGTRVAKFLGVQPWLGPAALASRMRSLRSPAIMHVATHGFFLERPEKAKREDIDDPPSRAFSLASQPDPMLRSGIALAGINNWLRGEQPPEHVAEGILTAADLAELDLRGTALVVLSACDTGLGDLQSGEGIVGLKRGLQLAGASTVVLSLWKVPDEQTTQLMSHFYEELASGVGIAAALRRAQMTVRRKFADPVFWGGFICEGSPGPFPTEIRVLLKRQS